jgi:hypothetical protein
MHWIETALPRLATIDWPANLQSLLAQIQGFAEAHPSLIWVATAILLFGLRSLARRTIRRALQSV